MNSWLNRDARAIILGHVAISCKRTCGILIRCGFVNMRDVRAALFVAPVWVRIILSHILTESVRGPSAARLLRQLDARYSFRPEHRVRFLDGSPVALWVLPALVQSVSTSELEIALAGAQAHVNYSAMWFIFRRIAQTGELEYWAAKALRDWIWSGHPGAASLVREFPLRLATMRHLLLHTARSDSLCSHLREHPNFGAVCWEVLVQAIIEGDLVATRDVLQIGVTLRDAPNLIELALQSDNVAVCAELLLRDDIVDKYVDGAIHSTRRCSTKMSPLMARFSLMARRKRLARLLRQAGE